MDDKLDEVIKKYPVTVKSKKRTRGAVLLETNDGIFIIKVYTGSKKRLIFEENIKKILISGGYLFVDRTIENTEGELLTGDGSGNDWVMKKWYSGEECDIRDQRKVCLSAAHMARLHKIMVFGEDKDIEIPVKIKDTGVQEIFEKHNREMKRVHGYIKEKRQKNEMEICLLNSFQSFYEQGKQAAAFLKKCDYNNLYECSQREKRIVHGSYNYHNIMFNNKNIITTNFQKAEIGIQISDLYGFLRKVMEKNGWDMKTGINLIESYRHERCLSAEENKTLYAMLLYPEKYWKLINFYYNGKKSWMSEKNYEKLQRICSQETERQKFLEEVKRLLI